MANGIKEYKIVINGLQESIDAVTSLNKQLDALEKKINSVSSAKVSAPTGGGSTRTTSNASALSEEERVQKEINKLKEQGAQLDAKIAASQDEVYKRVDATKQLYKETIADQKAIAAQERLTADAYSNTMVGIKQKLADIKQVMQTTDLGDTDKFSKLTKDANDLNSKLLEIEKSYGQFGRNVGNYAEGVAEGLGKIKITVGDTVREFGSAREASRTLNEELKAMAINGQSDTKEFKELRQVVMELESTMKDVKSPMDAIMDGFQSIAAIASTTQGISALFGVDSTEIERSIQKLVALQNVMQGIDTINKQIQTREGVGKWIAPFTVQIDKATAKLLAFNTTLLGTGKAASVAAKGIKLASTALKALASIGIVAVISIAIEKIMDLVESFNKLSDAEQAQKDAEEAMSKAYGEGQAKLIQYKTRLDSFNGSKKEEKKLVEELNKEFGTTLGTYKSLAEWQDVLKKKGELYIQMLVKQAKAQAALNGVTAAYTKLMQVQMGIANGEYDGIWNKIFGKSGEARLAEAQREVEQMTEMLEESQKDLENFNKDNNLGNYAPQIEKNTSKTKNALEESQRTLNQLELRLMQEGLNKKLRQLDEEERQTINKLKENGRKSAAEIQKIQRVYATLRAKEIETYLKSLDEKIKKSAQDIKKTKFELDLSSLDNEIEVLENKFNKLNKSQPISNTLTTRLDLKAIIGNESLDKIRDAYLFNVDKNIFERQKGDYRDYYERLKEYLTKQNEEVKEEFNNIKLEQGDDSAFNWLSGLFENEYENALSIVRSYNLEILDLTEEDLKKNEKLLSDSFLNRINSAKEYETYTLSKLREFINKESELNKQRIEASYSTDTESERERYRNQYNDLDEQRNLLNNEIEYYEKRNDVEIEKLNELKKRRKKIEQQMEDALAQHGEKMGLLAEKRQRALEKNELDTQNEIQSIQEKYYSKQISNYRDFQSKLNDEINKNPVSSKGWGIVNISETKKNYKEIIEASKAVLKNLREDKENLERDYHGGLISEEIYNETMSNINDIEKGVKDGMEQTQEASKNLIADFVSSIQGYLSTVVDSFSTIMNAVWDAQDVAFDKEQEQLDKWNDELDKKLDKQQEIIEQHKSNIDSIEDELATSRGDRRQHLIDQLNAEMEAQRAAQAEEQRIQKEKERAEKKQEELDLKRRKAEYKRNLTQAIVNGAMAVTMAAINKWPIPAIPMMALAASTTAAQIAIMASNKPYAKGGVLEGKSHAEGGIPIPGTGIEVEGKEYVVRKKSTTPNIDLLDYINKSERKLSLDDFIKFYGGKVRKNVTSMSPGRKYADGGALPVINDSYSFDDRLLSAFERYAERPSVVSVVDINNRQSAVKNVRVLAGLSD